MITKSSTNRKSAMRLGGVILFVLTFGYMLFREKKPVTVTADQQAVVDSLQQEITTLKAQYDARIEGLLDTIVLMRYAHKKYENKITETNKKANEKVTAISKSDGAELTKFLSDRYKDSLESK